MAPGRKCQSPAVGSSPCEEQRVEPTRTGYGAIKERHPPGRVPFSREEKEEKAGQRPKAGPDQTSAQCPVPGADRLVVASTRSVRLLLWRALPTPPTRLCFFFLSSTFSNVSRYPLGQGRSFLSLSFLFQHTPSLPCGVFPFSRLSSLRSIRDIKRLVAGSNFFPTQLRKPPGKQNPHKLTLLALALSAPDHVERCFPGWLLHNPSLITLHKTKTETII